LRSRKTGRFALLTPIRFGPPGRQLFGIHHSPCDGKGTQRGVLLCNPFGQEAIRSHPFFKVMADRIARQGFHAMRFDYFGTGDSDGDDHEGDLESWIDDVLRADEELARRSGGATRNSWFGLRLGGSIAALASARSARMPDQLILLDPVIDGSSYLAELERAHFGQRKASFGSRWRVESRVRDIVAREQGAEALGFPLTPPLRQQLVSVSPAAFAAMRTTQLTLLADRGTFDVSDLRRRLAVNGVGVSTQSIETGIDWTTNEAMNSSLVPVEALQAVLGALSALA